MKINKELNFSDLSISLPEVLLAMGCDASYSDPSLEKEIESLLAQLSTLVHPRFTCFTVDGQLHSETQQLQIADVTFSVGSIISRQLHQAESFLFFIATAGAEFDAWQHTDAIKNDILKSYIADTIGTLIAEKAADLMEGILETSLQPSDLKHTNRYSPGYCGWPVSQQHSLFQLFDEETPCGVSLTESSLMLPIKSVSGVIGLGQKVRKLDYTCGLCTFEKCFRRKHKSSAKAL